MTTRAFIVSAVVTAILALGATPAHGQGTILIQHLGANDPATEGFSFAVAPDSTVGPVFGDLGRDSWSVVSQGFPAEYYQWLTPQQQGDVIGSDWVFSATARIIQAPNISLAFYLGTQRFVLNFDLQADGDPIVNCHSDLSPVVVLEGGGAGYHDYELAYRAATRQASLWVDGIERANDITSTSGDAGWGVLWGVTSQGASSQANWHRVTLEIIPEPSTLALLGCGAVLLAGHWLRRFRRQQ